MASVLLENVYKIYSGDVVAVKDVSLEIANKEFLVLAGPSGCGKSTILRMIAGLEEASKGKLYIGERQMNEVPPKDRDVAMVFQNYALYPHMNAFKNMAFGLELRKTPKDEIKRRVQEAAKMLDIEHLLERKPRALSDVQRQHVALGRAMVRNPAVFLLDEPLSDLDTKVRLSMRDQLTRLHGRLDTTFVYATQDSNEAVSMGERIVVMKDGLIHQVDTPQNLYDFPCNMFVAGFIGTPPMNFVDGMLLQEKDGYFVKLPAGDMLKLPREKITQSLTEYAGKTVTVGIRPEDIHDDDVFLRDNPNCVLKTTVDTSELADGEVHLHLHYAETPLIARVALSTQSKAGHVVHVGVDTDKLYLFDAETQNTIFL